MKKTLIILLLFFVALTKLSYGGDSVMKNKLIEEELAVEFAKKFLQEKQYDYEIDWEKPSSRLEKCILRKDGSLSRGLSGKKIWVWHIWFLPSNGVDAINNIIPAVADVDAKTGNVFTKYSPDKL